MRDGWTDTTLGDIAEYINGYPFKPGDLGDDGTAVIRIKQLLDPMEKVDRTTVDVPERCVLSNGDIVFSWSGTLAVRVWNRGTAYLNQHLFRVIEKTGVSHEWLPLVIDHAIADLVEKSHGTTMKHITKQTLLPHQVLLPPLEEQKRIVDVVSSVDSYIDALQQQAATAHAARHAVLHELLSAGGDDWTETTLGDIGASGYFSDGDWVESKDQDPNGDFRLLQLADIGDGVFLNKSDRWLNREQFMRLRCTSLGHRDILIARMPDPIARACLFPLGLPVSATVVDVAILRCGRGYLPEFLVLMINDATFRAAAYSLLTGTTRQRISRSNLAAISVVLPPMVVQKRIVDVVSSMDDVIHFTEQAVGDAKKLRSGLLSDLLSGEHEIPASYDSLLGAA